MENETTNISQDTEKKSALTPDDILNFEPSIDYKGYSPVEVDKFLDTVMNDYYSFLDQIKCLKESRDQSQQALGQSEAELDAAKKELTETKALVEGLNERIEQLNTELDSEKASRSLLETEYQAKLETAKADAAKAAEASNAAAASYGSGTQVDMLRRLARLEAEVFGKKNI